MTYEAKTEVGKTAIAEGADPEIVEQQEKEGSLADVIDTKEKEKDPLHVEKTPPAETLPADKEPKDDKGGEGGDKGKDKDGAGGDELPNRTPQSMPVWKHKEELKNLREQLEQDNASKIEQAVAAAASKKGGTTSEDVGKIAEEFNLTPEVAGAMVDRITTAIEQKLGLGDLRKEVESAGEAR